MTTKFQAIASGAVGALSGFVSWVATVPPEMQSGLLAQFVELMPVPWRPTIGLWTKFLGTVATIYAVHKASRSGPQSPPKNTPQ